MEREKAQAHKQMVLLLLGVCLLYLYPGRRAKAVLVALGSEVPQLRDSHTKLSASQSSVGELPH